MENKKHWLDYASSLALPAVIGLGGLLYTIHKDGVDRMRNDQNYRQQVSLEQWKQDAGYVQLLASSNPKERQFAGEIIKQLRSEGTFPHDLEITVNTLADGRPSDQITQTAALTSPKAANGLPKTPRAIPVFIQYATRAQLCDVQKLAARLRMIGFTTPPPELRQGPLHTDVRYFSLSSNGAAIRVGQELSAIGYPNIASVFQARSPVEFRQIEVWFGSRDNPHVGTTESGQAITTEDGDYVVDSSCDPFVIGKSPIG